MCIRDSLEELDVEQQVEEVGLGHDQEGADEEHPEAPEEEAVQAPREEHLEDAQLHEGVPRNEPEALRQGGEAVEALCEAVGGGASVEAPDKDGDGREREQVHGQDDHMTDVPVDLSAYFHRRCFRSCLLY